MTLAGLESRFLVISLLGSVHPEQLRYLHLDNLQQFSELDGIPQTLSRLEKGRTRPRPPVFGKPGPMSGHLAPFTGKRPNLEALAIDTAGEAGNLPADCPPPTRPLGLARRGRPLRRARGAAPGCGRHATVFRLPAGADGGAALGWLDSVAVDWWRLRVRVGGRWMRGL